MELEGTLQVERPPTRRWIPVVGVIVPVAGFVIVAAWFIRAFVAPPMVAIPGPGMLVAEPPAASMMARGEMTDPPAPASERTASKMDTDRPPPAQQSGTAVLASLASAPASLASGSPSMTAPTATAYTDPAPETRQAAEIEPGEPITGPIPLPARRPKLMVAQVVLSGPVPLPRPRPADAAERPETEVEVPDRHNVQ